MKKVLSLASALLLVAMLLSTFAFAVFAADEEADVEETFPDYTTIVYATEEAKLETMVKKLDMNGYELYIQPQTAEVAVRDKKSGQILFTNPYDVASSKGTEATKNKLLSQILVSYVDNGTAKEYSSYADSAKLGQILIKDIKNGVRVEYTIGRANANYLVPRMISKDRLESQILANIDSKFYYTKIISFYDLKDPFDETLPQSVKAEMQRAYPVTKNMAVYVLSSDIVNRELAYMENIIKTYAPDYTYEEMEYDHQMTQYEAKTLSTPVFRMSLEYTLSEDGLVVTLPANGIRFDETLYKLQNITVLPYMGAGTYTNEGYTFIPDGSGALMDYADFSGRNTSIAGTVYGTDFAYQTLEGAANQDVMRMPVYGIVETREKIKYVPSEKTYTETVEITDPETGEVTTEEVEQTITVEEAVRVKENRGFLAIIEEGDALARIAAKHENQLHNYNSVQLTVNPRPKDSYVLSDSISVGSSSSIEVVSDRKYVGSYKIKYIMLTDDTAAEENNIEDYYETSWMGMARAYRDYLMKNGTLTRLTDADVKSDIPLYIETFGVTQTIEKILSVPTTVDKALTSFDNVKTIYDELAAAGITNIDFRLNGYANGGMYPTIPSKLKWEKVAGGKSGYEDLLAYAEEKGFGVYPDFDFSYVHNQKSFDGLKLSRDIVKTIDNRYSSLREYDPSLQAYVSYYTLCVSPSVYSQFYTKFAKNYLKDNTKSISISTIGNTLNSDFDSDEPYNRNDAKKFTEEFLAAVKSDVASVMSDKGNVYTWQYIDKMLNVSLQSSRSLYASASVPFMGVVLHGSVEFAGTALNMAGDVDYDLLKAIENGAGIYFILSYDNTELLKEDFKLSKYYSVRYDIWHDELIQRYNELNELLRDVQTSLITGHEFLIGERVPTDAERAADAVADAEAKREADEKAAEEARKDAMKAMREEYVAGNIAAGQTIEYTVEEKPARETEGYKYTKYTSDDNSIVLVTYENGKRFILNYNNFDITTVVDGKTYTVGNYGYTVIQ